MTDEDKAFILGMIDERSGVTDICPFPQNRMDLCDAWIEGRCFSIINPVKEDSE